MAASGKNSNTVMQYEQTLFYEKKNKKKIALSLRSILN